MPPGAKPTTHDTTRLGKSCALAPVVASASSAAAASLAVHVMIVSGSAESRGLFLLLVERARARHGHGAASAIPRPRVNLPAAHTAIRVQRPRLFGNRALNRLLWRRPKWNRCRGKG